MKYLVTFLMLGTVLFADVPSHLRPNPSVTTEDRTEIMINTQVAMEQMAIEVGRISLKLDALERTNELLMANYNMLSQIAWHQDHPITETKRIPK